MSLADLAKHDPTWFYDLRATLQRHVDARSLRAFADGDAARDAIGDSAALRSRQRLIRDGFLAGIGGVPALGGPLEARVVGEVRCAGFRIERVIFATRPKTPVTANLYLPDGITAPRGAVLFLSGHNREAKHHPEYQMVCQHLALAGLVVLAQDPPGQGERFGYWDPATKRELVEWGVTEHDHVGWQCLPLGESLARWFLHDAMRGIDYLLTRPEVDPARIGVTGNSGGGTQTAMVMLADPRVAAAAPATFVMDRRSYMESGGAQDAEQIWPCFSALGLDHEDILAAMAPKPVRVLAVTSDFFPIEGTRRTVGRAQRLFAVAGAPSALDLVEDRSVHNYTPALARAAASFFSQHLLGTRVEVDSARVAPLPPERLWCTPEGQVRAAFADARDPHDEVRDRAEALRRGRAGKAGEALAWLRARVHAGRGACSPNLRVYGKGADPAFAAEFGLWRSLHDLMGNGTLLRDPARAGQTLPVTIALWRDGTRALAAHEAWLRAECGRGRAVLVLNASGMGALEPYGIPGKFGRLHKLATDLLFLGDDLASLRAWDCLRALAALDEWPGVDARDVRGHAHGRDGIPLRLAALVEPRLRDTVAAEAPAAFADWVLDRLYDDARIEAATVHGALARFDLPELERAAAGAAR